MQVEKRACVFLDRDGIINKDYVDYTYTIERFELMPGVKEALQSLKSNGYLLVLITNQSGIAKGIYSHEDVAMVHGYMNELLGHPFDAIYYSPYHQTISNSLSRKPDSLLFERAIAKFDIDISKSWMVGDRPRDMTPAKKLGIPCIHVLETPETPCEGDISANDLPQAVQLILSNKI